MLRLPLLYSPPSGKLCHFCTTDMNSILQRYRHWCYTSQVNNGVEHESDSETLYHEVLTLRAKYESLQLLERHLLGEDIEPLNMKELEILENKLDRSLSQIRERKTQKLFEQMKELWIKGHKLAEINRQLTSELGEGDECNRGH
ncbi:MADS-box transcription factor [Quillaja saponaria]|uniref:MADS-box transcription factor n=1 Tax=Quillaja saponaria TaxID=32244 RepID=A0AAD7Q678_QUISA|nr:MADS-box transcription factor [Quillaja saponaria]